MNLTSNGRSTSRPEKPLSTTFSNDANSGFVDEDPQADPYSVSSVPHSGSSRWTDSNASLYPPASQSSYPPDPDPPMTQTMYQPIHVPH